MTSRSPRRCLQTSHKIHKDGRKEWLMLCYYEKVLDAKHFYSKPFLSYRVTEERFSTLKKVVNSIRDSRSAKKLRLWYWRNTNQKYEATTREWKNSIPIKQKSGFLKSLIDIKEIQSGECKTETSTNQTTSTDKWRSDSASAHVLHACTNHNTKVTTKMY